MTKVSSNLHAGPAYAYERFNVLGNKQEAIQEGIELLRTERTELARNRSQLDDWGNVAIFANVSLIPLNAIINSFELTAAKTAYEVVVRQVYSKFARSGTRSSGHAMTALSLLKDAIATELKRKSMTEFIPGVNILVGLAEDSLAAYQTINLVQNGRAEAAGLGTRLDWQISKANQQLLLLGIKRAEWLQRMQTIDRTA